MGTPSLEERPRHPRRRDSDHWTSIQFTAHDVAKALIVLIPGLGALGVGVFQVGLWVSTVNANIDGIRRDLQEIKRRLPESEGMPKINTSVIRSFDREDIRK